MSTPLNCCGPGVDCTVNGGNGTADNTGVSSPSVIGPSNGIALRSVVIGASKAWAVSVTRWPGAACVAVLQLLSTRSGGPVGAADALPAPSTANPVAHSPTSPAIAVARGAWGRVARRRRAAGTE